MEGTHAFQLPPYPDEEASGAYMEVSYRYPTRRNEASMMHGKRALAALCLVASLLVLALFSGGSQRLSRTHTLTDLGPGEMDLEPAKREGLGARAAQPSKSLGSQGQQPAHHNETSGLTFVTIETDPDLGLGLELTNFTKRTGAPIHNPGKGQKWVGYRFKIVAWQKFVASRRAELGPDADKELLVLVDNRDLFWAGCELSDLRARYDRIAKQSSAPIVFNAEVNCGAASQTCKKVGEPPRDFRGKITPWIGGCSLRCNGTWHDVCTPCGQTHSTRYLNSGFMMGPMGAISQMLDWTLEHLDDDPAALSVYGDQAVFMEYWVQHPDQVTLDYGGELCMQSLSFQGLNAYKVDTHSRKVSSPMLGGRAACFIHGAGWGRMSAAWLLSQLYPGHPAYELSILKGEGFLDPIMPLIEVEFPKFFRSPQNVHIPDGDDNFLDLPTRNVGGLMKKMSEKYNNIKAEPCLRSTCAAITEPRHIDG